ncbi:class I lanthipeptide [Chitinophaga sp.]|uniref:class I lanthipeptide n=1 Tax=Chitinophaga sp. TaxID=1869181 RepID=UPI0039C85F58
MKKKLISTKKLALSKLTISNLSANQVTGGGWTDASLCYSCMSQCLCDPPPPGPTGVTGPCCPIPQTVI